MPEIPEHKPKNFTETMEIIENFQISHNKTWYRGSNNSAYELMPALFRHKNKKKIEESHAIELEIATTFQQRSPPFVNQPFANEWDQMFFMQHYGIPTRLLDWTASPFIALYFALTASERTTNGKPRHNACLWMLNPGAWNKGALHDISFPEKILTPKEEQVKSYSPEVELSQRKNLPIMIYGTHNSPRIVAQRGMFALFGKSMTSMESAYISAENFPSEILHKIIIEKEHCDEIATSLFKKGISDSTIYPDLFGLALELKRDFGFSQ